MILSDSKVNTSPPIEKIKEYGQTKTPDPPKTDWTKCPLIEQGPEFDFKKITKAEILSVLLKMKKSSPGKSNITYKDIEYCDPSGCILEKL